MTRQEAINWCASKLGQAIDYDGAYGAQCVDFSNAYANMLFNNGTKSFVDGLGAAWQLFDGAKPEFYDKERNNPANLAQLPSKGDLLIQNSKLPYSGGSGHVQIVDFADANGYWVYEQNWGGMFVKRQYHNWSGFEIGWLIPKPFRAPPPPPPPTPVDPTIELNATIARLTAKLTDAEVRLGTLETALNAANLALINEQNKPAKEVVVTVEKIVEKVINVPVVEIVEVPVNPTWLQAVIDWINNVLGRSK